MGQDEALHHLHGHGGQSDGSVVVQARDLGLLGDRDDCRRLEARWDATPLQ